MSGAFLDHCDYDDQPTAGIITSPTGVKIPYCEHHEWRAEQNATRMHYIFADSPYGLIILGSMDGRNHLYAYQDVFSEDCEKLGLEATSCFYANSDDVAKRPDLQMALQYTKTRYADLLKVAMQRTEAA